MSAPRARPGSRSPDAGILAPIFTLDQQAEIRRVLRVLDDRKAGPLRTLSTCRPTFVVFVTLALVVRQYRASQGEYAAEAAAWRHASAARRQAQQRVEALARRLRVAAEAFARGERSCRQFLPKRTRRATVGYVRRINTLSRQLQTICDDVRAAIRRTEPRGRPANYGVHLLDLHVANTLEVAGVRLTTSRDGHLACVLRVVREACGVPREDLTRILPRVIKAVTARRPVVSPAILRSPTD